ncbi:2-oxoglutarate dehydrogenase E1 component [Buchnera aphidicola (Kurisakia onigurumii)]|uniref:2-oxoglutarate dehydrogenase E1 component n=1 Tax=Buchnera aphidicola TaxID=9 RepID=UPI0031B6E17D
MNNKNFNFWNSSSWLYIANQSYIESIDSYKDNSFTDFSLLKQSFSKINNKIDISIKKNNFLYKNYSVTRNKIDTKNNSTQVSNLINFFRTQGYKYANTNPLKKIDKKKLYSKCKKYFKNIKEHECEIINIFFPEIKKFYPLLNNLVYILEKIYCRSVGSEYMHLDNMCEKKWIQRYIENQHPKFFFTNDEKINILKKIIKSEEFEKYLHTNFPGSKRFSLEGCEVLIPLLNYIINICTQDDDTKNIFLAMAHRGRLNVLSNIFKKNIKKIVNEFQGTEIIKKNYNGDVKYHLGYDRVIKNKNNKKLYLNIRCNPSHLEIVYPVLMGAVRLQLDLNKRKNRYKKVIPIIIHGDAAISGQGVVQESLNMSQTRAYGINGSIHIVINNQIGFTTSEQKDLRSTQYCTDIAKMINSPVFHVNADDPESVLFIGKLALDFRNKFKKDVFIDLLSYRRNGHNEVDDPSVTQPLMYQKIHNHPTICQIFNSYLISQQVIKKNFLSKIKKNFYQKLYEKILDKPILKNKNYKKNKYLLQNKKNYVDKNILKKLFNTVTHIPNKISLHPLVKKIYFNKIKLFKEKKMLDWGSAEILAYSRLLYAGISCRLTGQDVNRGTFFHRHINVYDQNNGLVYTPLKNINYVKGNFDSWDSVLSEESSIAFEYGYSVNQLHTLTIWEAQFGDFANGAQNIIDQFIVSGEKKWGDRSNLILLLPHGYEGQGPEHSSARIERYLQLSAEKNIEVCIPTTSSQMYNLICNQIFKKNINPLIIISPKSMLRNSLSYSKINDFEKEKFLNVIIDTNNINSKNITKIIFCSGKIYYELFEKKIKYQINNISIIRIEKMYPFPIKDIKKIIEEYSHVKEYIWCQEEPLNQGSWTYIKDKINIILYSYNINKIRNDQLKYVGRPISSCTAVGNINMHVMQQKRIIQEALNLV